MKELLSAIYAYYQKTHPDSIGYVFGLPASSAEIAAVETAIGIQFPDDLRELYLQYGQLIQVWDMVSVHPLKFIPDTHRDLLELAAEQLELAAAEGIAMRSLERALGHVDALVHTTMRIPFAQDNDLPIMMDMKPSEGGKVGQIVRLNMEFSEIEVIADSLRAFFEQGLERLRLGNANL